jgi:D-inositol-3-phosphate glycosyltransferase
MERLYGRAPAAYAVIPPGVDGRLFRPLDQGESRRMLGVDADKVILFVGRLDPIKGLNLVIRDVGELVPFLPYQLKVLVVGGETSRGRVARYRRLATRVGLENVVDFRGVVPERDLPRYYAAADVCALPSAYESFGMAALESMSCQTPVVAFGVGGHADTIRDGETGFLARAGQPADYTRKLREALRSDGLETMGRRARLSVQRFTWKATADRTVELYKRLARGHASACCGALRG